MVMAHNTKVIQPGFRDCHYYNKIRGMVGRNIISFTLPYTALRSVTGRHVIHHLNPYAHLVEC